MSTNAYYLNQFISTTLSTIGGIDDIQTTGIKFLSVSGIDISKPGIACLSYSDPLSTTTAEWITFTSIDGTNELQGVTRGAEGYAAKSHSNGVAVAFPISESHINNLNDALIIGGVETNLVDGVLDEDAMGTNSATKLATQQSTKAYVDNGTWLKDSMLKQAIMNGNFDVSQRGVTSGTITDSSVVFVMDRWADFHAKDGGTLPTLTRTKETLTHGDLGHSFYFSRLTTNGAGTSLGNNSLGEMFQKIEYGTRFLAGLNKTITLSFYARTDIANKKLGINIEQSYGTGGSPSATEILSGSVKNLTSSWTKYTVTFTTNTLAGKTFGTANNDFLALDFVYAWGSTAGTGRGLGAAETYVGAGTIDIAQVQLCAGDVALPFMPKSYVSELADCQRYCVVYGGNEENAGDAFKPVRGTFVGQTAAAAGGVIYFPVQMRAEPTFSATAAKWRLSDFTGAVTLTGIAIGTAQGAANCCIMDLVAASGITQYRPYALQQNNDAATIMVFSSEL